MRGIGKLARFCPAGKWVVSTQFHVRPLAVGAPAPASVVNHDLSVLLRLWIPSRSETSLFAPLRALVKNDEGHTWTLFWRHGMPFEGSMVSVWPGRYR